MEKIIKLFIKASILYLALGVFFGLHVAVADHAAAELRFIHVHVMLLGFMAMMIFGVAYHILPRFNAKPVPYPSWIPVQFWMANIGLWGMCVLYAMGALWNSGPLRMAFGFFSALEGVSILLFVINIFYVLKDEPAEKPAPPAPEPKKDEPAEKKENTASEEVKLAPSMKISEILEKWPHLRDMMLEQGFSDVANPAVMNTVAKMVSLEMASKKAGKDVFEVIAVLEGKQLVTADDNGSAPTPVKVPGAETIKRGDKASAKTLIGPLIDEYPETKKVFETHYGAACFTCPGHKTETVEQTAAMHGMPAEKILDEINAIIEQALKG